VKRFSSSWVLRPVAMALVASAAASCGGDSGDPATAACNAAAAHLRDCHLLSEGTVDCSGGARVCTGGRCMIFGDGTCLDQCMSKASCADLEPFVCGGVPTGSIGTCITSCSLFQCGNGASIEKYKVCDGKQDCADGADEAGCPTFTCADGSKIPAEGRCDGFPQCDDQSDELGCPMFRCGDGSSVPEQAKCDGRQQCPDGSDEVGCPTFTCADGSKVPADRRCDGFPQCDDRSDELGCPARATLICSATTAP